MKKIVYILAILSIVVVYMSYKNYIAYNDNIKLREYIRNEEQTYKSTLEKVKDLEIVIEDNQDKIDQLQDSNDVLRNRVSELIDKSELERTVLSLFKKKEKTEEDISDILTFLPMVNWIKMNEISDINAETFLEWIERLDIKNEEDFINILKLGKNVDGAYAEYFSAIVENIFLTDSINLMKTLTKIPENIESISNYLAYSVYGSEKYNTTKQKLELLLSSDKLSENEKETVKEFIHGLKGLSN